MNALKVLKWVLSQKERKPIKLQNTGKEGEAPNNQNQVNHQNQQIGSIKRREGTKITKSAKIIENSASTKNNKTAKIIENDKTK